MDRCSSGEVVRKTSIGLAFSQRDRSLWMTPCCRKTKDGRGAEAPNGATTESSACDEIRYRAAAIARRWSSDM